MLFRSSQLVMTLELSKGLEQWSPTLVQEIYFPVESSANHGLPHLLQLINFFRRPSLAGSEVLVLSKVGATF